MGCNTSKEVDAHAIRVDIDKKSVSRKGTPRPSGKEAPAKEEPVNRDFETWNQMERSEEMSYLHAEEDNKELDAALHARFPESARRTDWQDVSAKVHDEEVEEIGDIEFGLPWTREKAAEFHKWLCLTDERRRNPMRADDAPPIPALIYGVMFAAIDLYEARADRAGALQRVASPTSGASKLRVCGDTHGQLQDVLWIFDEHGAPAPDNAYLFNGDIADRGRHALEIFLLLLLYQLADPASVHINRGNHEQRDLNERSFQQGGGFAWELRAKYPHDEKLVELFARFFNLMPLAAVVGEWAMVIHGGLFREPNVTLKDVEAVHHRRDPPQPPVSADDCMLFDALWADPHAGDGIKIGSARGVSAMTFGADVTRDFCARNGIKSIVRSHQTPPKQRGFEIQHDAMLLTIFSASNYGGICRNKGGVLIFDENGPAEVKEFYAPELDHLRAMFEYRATEAALGHLRDRIAVWRDAATQGHRERHARQSVRHVQSEKRRQANVMWKHLLVNATPKGEVRTEEERRLVAELPGVRRDASARRRRRRAGRRARRRRRRSWSVAVGASRPHGLRGGDAAAPAAAAAAHEPGERRERRRHRPAVARHPPAHPR